MLVHALANFASWLAGMACEATGLNGWLSPHKTCRKLYFTMRVGCEALARSWPIGRICEGSTGYEHYRLMCSRKHKLHHEIRE